LFDPDWSEGNRAVEFLPEEGEVGKKVLCH
jgi:hypothetical protein